MTDLTARTDATADRAFTGPLEPVDECTWRIPRSYKPGMLVDGLIYADERLIPHLRSDRAPEQVANVAFLPGIQQATLGGEHRVAVVRGATHLFEEPGTLEEAARLAAEWFAKRLAT
ncbi:MAG: hypothetical protein ACKOEX_06980 [Planctomycetia bacterium]